MRDALPAGLFANHLPEPVLIPAPGAPDSVAALARLWFLEHLGHLATAGTRMEAVR